MKMYVLYYCGDQYITSSIEPSIGEELLGEIEVVPTEEEIKISTPPEELPPVGDVFWSNKGLVKRIG